ncbi:MAG: hypothetical protein ACRBB2_06165 [Nitrosopumilus sp.]
MDFLKKRIKKYQEKKLEESMSKIKFHTDMKKQLENKKKEDLSNYESIEKEILFHKKMLAIWTENVEKIKKEMNKIDI